MACGTGITKLPEEIWEIIILMATSGPTLTTYREPNIAFGWPDTYDQLESEKPFFLALRTRLSVVLVCATFRSLGMKPLYETIILKGADSSKALASSISPYSSLYSCFAPYTKNIIVSPRSSLTDEEIPIFFSAVITIFKRCSSLQCIIMRDPVGTYSHWWPKAWGKFGGQIARAIPLSVTHLDIGSHLSSIGGLQLHLLSKSLSVLYLRSLRIGGSVSKGNIMISYAFPSLTHLCVDFTLRNCMRLIPLWKMDNLTHLYLSNVLSDSSTEVSAFWAKTKPSITLLHFGATSCITQELASRILGGVPNLQTLEYFHPGDVPPIWKNDLLPRSLKLITVAVESECLEIWADYLRLAEQLYEFQCPPLPCSDGPPIVLLDHHYATHKRQDELWRALSIFPDNPSARIKCSELWS